MYSKLLKFEDPRSVERERERERAFMIGKVSRSCRGVSEIRTKRGFGSNIIEG